MAQAEGPDGYDEELARIEASIADLKVRDLAAAKERTTIASKIQAAQFQRDILAHANQQKAKKAARPKRVRRPPAETPPAIPPAAGSRPPGPPPRTPRSQPRGAVSDGVTMLLDDPPPSGPGPRPRSGDRPLEHPPETSTQSVQNILLAVGALLLGVAAVVFAGIATSNPFGRSAILAVATVTALLLAPGIARRGLSSTAETVAAVGLILLPMTLYALHGSRITGGPGTPVPLYLGVTFAITAVAAFVYAGSTRLSAPRYATVIALQPVPPLLAFPAIESPAGWGTALTAVAVLDLLLLTTVIRRGPLVPRWPFGRPVAADRESGTDPRDLGAADFAGRNADLGDPAGYEDDAPPRPESRPEEPDLIIRPLTGRSRRWLPTRIFPGPRPAGAPAAASVPLDPGAVPPAARWLRELTFALLCLAVAGALLQAGGALIGAGAVSDAVRSGLILVLAAICASAAARLLGQVAVRNVAGGVLVLAIIAACARVADVAAPRWMLAIAALAVGLTGAAVRRVPEEVRRGPQWASAGALILIGLVAGVAALRAALAPVEAARPVWHADTAGYAQAMIEAAPAGWLLALSALLATLAAAVALPTSVRQEGAVAGVAVTALAVPAALRMPWAEAPWPLVLAAIALGATGLLARTRRIAITHTAAAGAVGLFGAATALSASWLTAAVLTALAGAGVMVAVAARQIPIKLYAWLVGDWAAGAAALALPGAAVSGVLAVSDTGTGPPNTPGVTVPALAVGFLVVAGTLTYAAVFQVARREISLPLTVGTGLGALSLALAAILADGATAADMWVGALLLVAAGLLFFAKSIDAGLRSDRMLDGPDIAAAAATVAICGALARVAALAYPTAPLVVAGVVVLAVGFGVRALPLDWRRGPVRGLALAGIVVGGIAAFQALAQGLRILAAPGPLWSSQVDGYSATPPPGAWQAPVTLLLIAVAAATALTRPMSYDVGAVCAAIATIGGPACFGLPWWSPLVVGGAVALGYGISSVAALDPRAALARAAVAGVVSLHFSAVSLVLPWSTAVALGLVVLIGVLVAALARAQVVPATVPTRPGDNRDWPAQSEAGNDVVNLALDDTGMPRHRAQIGGGATAAVLLCMPGVFAAIAADQGRSVQIVLTSALAASSLSLAVLALLGRWIPQYLPWATVGLVVGATGTAVATLPTGFPTALYAAAAALLGVVAELLRGATPAPGLTVAPAHRYFAEGRYVRPRWTEIRPSGLRGRWLVPPATGAVVVATIPTVLAMISIAPVLVAALVTPFQQLSHIWQGPVPELVNPPHGSADGTTVIAAVLLTVAVALAATGFGGKTSEAVPVILPGLAITLLIAPIALNADWPASTSAALVVFTIAMLGLALTPPPIASHAPLLRTTRAIVFVIGLLAGGAGLAGALATKPLTLFTLGSAVAVGLVAAIVGRSSHARILGWLFAAVEGQFFVLTVALVAGLTPAWAAFGVLAVGAVLLIIEATLPRLGQPQYRREAATVEWTGYASAVLAGALAYNSPSHLAALLAAWGAVMGLAAARNGRSHANRRMLFWLAMAFEIIGWWLFIALAEVALPEAYTLPFAALALLVGLLEVRQRPDLSSWAAYGPALLAAFVPTIGIVLATKAGNLRELLLLLGAVTTLIIGSRLRQQAPVVVGAITTAIAAIHFAMTLVGPWTVLVPVGMVLLLLGATNENRRRTDRLKGALVRMR
ncbi:MAG: hypothetical protein QOE51_4897 [Actinoplanes sp.]|nr:hypothetical protein [Actinoplanes sp.]